MYCIKCSLKFNEKYAFELHLSLKHGQKIQVKTEPEIYKEKSHEPQISEKSFSDHVESKSPTTLRLATLKMKQKQGWTAKVNQILMQWKVMNASFAVTAFQTRFS